MSERRKVELTLRATIPVDEIYTDENFIDDLCNCIGGREVKGDISDYQIHSAFGSVETEQMSMTAEEILAWLIDQDLINFSDSWTGDSGKKHPPRIDSGDCLCGLGDQITDIPEPVLAFLRGAK